MGARDLLRYVVALIAAVAMMLSGSSPWDVIGLVLIPLVVVAFAWHQTLASRASAGE